MPCTCKNCGCSYKVDLILPDGLWFKISDDSSSGLLCGKCIMEKIEKLDKHGSLKVEYYQFQSGREC